MWQEIMKKEDNKFLDEIASTRYFQQKEHDDNELKHK